MPVLSRPSFINALQTFLISGELPGGEAHERMAHPVRKANRFPVNDEVKNAAVLMVLFENQPGDFQLIFIRRITTQNGDKHSGQIAFPGGRQDVTDRDLMYTALREAEEEIGLDLSMIDVLGALSPIYINVSNFLVHPYVAYSSRIPSMSRQEKEIDEILELPLSLFSDPDVRQKTHIDLSSGIRLNQVPCFNIKGQIIWGATAMIMNEFLEVIDKI